MISYIQNFLKVTLFFLLVVYLFLFMDIRMTPAVAEEKGFSSVVTDVTGIPTVLPASRATNEDVTLNGDYDYSVQAVLSSGNSIVVSAPIDGLIKEIKFESGDKFKKGDILIEYDCSAEKAKVREILAKLSVSNREAEAYERLKKMDVVSEVEYVSVIGSNRQDKEVYNQANTRLKMCKVKAPFDGRIQDKVVNNHEVIKSGRVLMKIASSDPLNVELLVPSIWLRWLNVGVSLDVYIRESDKTYSAEIIRIHGEVDPVSQTVHLIAKIDDYEEELLPGMSGRAIFNQNNRMVGGGFMGLSVGFQ